MPLRKVSFFRNEILIHNPESKVMRRRRPYPLEGEKEMVGKPLTVESLPPPDTKRGVP